MPGSSRNVDEEIIKCIRNLKQEHHINILNLGKVNILQYLKKNSLKKCFKILNKEDYLKASTQIGHNVEEFKRVFDILLLK